jgi:2-polyprenyl-6-methoxyphenol hydroxylase-like FAD-dependent oxidoreductase
LTAIVIGAGIAGLAAGLALTRAGVDVGVFERATDLQEVGAGISLWANAIHALDRLGLPGVIQSVGAVSALGQLRSDGGRILSAPAVDEIQRKLGVVCVVMHRAELLNILLDAFGRSRVYLRSHCVGLSQTVDRVTAEFDNGRVFSGDILLGADGLHSVVRAVLHGPKPPSYAGYTAWRAVVPFDTSMVVASESWGPGKRFGLVPMSAGRIYWYATQNVDEGQRYPSEKAALREMFRGWHTPIEAVIDATDESAILRNDIYDRPVLTEWGSGRVTLVGDAAHPMTPNLGQGACQALEDAVVLGDSLQTHPNVQDALRAYEARRLPRANAFVNQSRQLGRFAQWEQPWAIAVRNFALRWISPRLQERQLERMAGYRV